MERASTSQPLQRTASSAVPRTPRSSSPIKPAVMPSAASWTCGSCASGIPPCMQHGQGGGGSGSAPGSGGDAHDSIGTLAVYALGLLFCILLLLSSYNERHKEALAARITMRGDLGSQQSSNVLPEQQQVPRLQYLEMQIQQREEEILGLKTTLGEMLAESQVAEENMKAQDIAIRALQRKHESERLSREKAQFALGEQTQALEQCQALSKVLDAEVASCTKHLGEARRAATGTSGQAPVISRRRREASA